MNIPTAEEYLLQNLPLCSRKMGLMCNTIDARKIMLGFAKLHREAIMEAMIQKSRIDCPRFSDMVCSVEKGSILNCYPEENIK